MHHQFKESVGVVAFDREMPEERGEDVISIFMNEKGIHTETDMTENQCHQYAMSHGATVRDGSVATQEEGFESMTAGVSEIENFPQSALLELMMHDKKNSDGKITFILLNSIGKPVISPSTPLSDIHASLDIYIDMMS